MKKNERGTFPHGDFFLFDIEQGGRPPPEKKRKAEWMKQGGRSLPEIKKKDQFDAPKFFG